MSDQSIREALENLVKTIRENPEKAHSKNTAATATLREGLKFQVTGPRGEKVETDMPPAMGGGATASNPAWLLRAGLASCTATVIAMRAAKLGVALNTLEVSVESESDNRGVLGLDQKVSAGLSAFRTQVRVGAKNATEEQLRDIVRWADEHSPVACTLREAPANRLDIEIVA
jgi:uncharacterized OsmC-like protein